jgi:uncharacterized damage-inducible protein DinB
MKDDFVSLYAYNRWADRRVLDACSQLTPEQYAAEPVPGWSSVRSSLVHIAAVTNNWLRRVAGEEVLTALPPETDFPALEDAERLLDRADRTWEGLLPALTPERLTAPRTFRGSRGSAVLPPWAVLRHMVNHSTYHRGQVASKLKRLGVEPPVTDFYAWAVEQTPQQG